MITSNEGKNERGFRKERFLKSIVFDKIHLPRA